MTEPINLDAALKTGRLGTAEIIAVNGVRLTKEPEAAPPATPAKRRRREKAPLLPASFDPPATWVIPLHVTAGDNTHTGTRARVGRSGHEKRVTIRTLALAHRQIADFAFAAQESVPITIRLTRIGARRMDDDNLAAACKYARDAIADFLGVDDGAPNLRWVYQQEIGVACGVRIELEA